MNRRWVTLALITVLVLAATGCKDRQATTAIEASVQQPVSNPISETDSFNEAESEMEMEAEQESPSIITGDAVKLETSIEHEAAIFDGTEYIIEPYGVFFALRTSMGKPAAQEESFLFTNDFSNDGSGQAAISYEVVENMSLNQAVDQELQDQDASFYGDFSEITSKNGLNGMHNQYQDESSFSGVVFFEIGEHVLRIEYRSPIAFVDAMNRIVNEAVDSVKLR